MRRANRDAPSSFGTDIGLRMNGPTYRTLASHMTRDLRQEQIAFGWGRPARTSAGTLFLVSELLLPDDADLGEQTSVSVGLRPQTLDYVFLQAARSGTVIVEFHTHPGDGKPYLSGVDEHHGYANAQYLCETTRPPATFAMVVGNQQFASFDGVIFDRFTQQFHPLDRLEIVGRPTRVFALASATLGAPHHEGSFRDRQMLVLGQNDVKTQPHRIGIVGLGGNGAALLQALVHSGLGHEGFFCLIDHERIQRAGLPSIPYACPEDVGAPRVAVAAQYARRKLPAMQVFAFACCFGEKSVRERMKLANVLFHCGQTAEAREEVNEFAVRYGIPLIDLGCDIQSSKGTVHPGGQVRLVLPGENACLACNGRGVAPPSMEQIHRAGMARRRTNTATPGGHSESPLDGTRMNRLVVQHAIWQYLALVHGGEFAAWDRLHFAPQAGEAITLRSQPRGDCPVCGEHGILGRGDP